MTAADLRPWLTQLGIVLLVVNSRQIVSHLHYFIQKLLILTRFDDGDSLIIHDCYSDGKLVLMMDGLQSCVTEIMTVLNMFGKWLTGSEWIGIWIALPIMDGSIHD
jgi:hypothetical protein